MGPYMPETQGNLSMKDDTIKVRVNPDEKQAFQEAAEIAGIGLSAWVRERLRRSAIRELEEMSRPIHFLDRARPASRA
jgi:uncharacterized protein (DUF1778 family)